jgi:hypothetical protein
MNRKNDLHTYMFEESIHTGVVIACFDAFCKTIKQKTIVMIDNASIHRSEEFEDRIPFWKQQGLIIKYLPTYSPELNLIEILWRRIKYDWLPFSAGCNRSRNTTCKLSRCGMLTWFKIMVIGDLNRRRCR